MANPAKYVWLDEGLKDSAQSGVPIVNAGLHYGFTVFEGFAVTPPPAVRPSSGSKNTSSVYLTRRSSSASAIFRGLAIL